MESARFHMAEVDTLEADGDEMSEQRALAKARQCIERVHRLLK